VTWWLVLVLAAWLSLTVSLAAAWFLSGLDYHYLDDPTDHH
jgi:hypothetical protein